MTLIKKLWVGMIILVVISPLGLLLPDHFKAGAAWGEWGMDEIQKMTGYVPQGFEKLSEFWKAPMPDYSFQGWEEKALFDLSFAYIVSALAGIILIVGIIGLLGKLLVKE
ncbi:MAG: PDGLE domain-containing protein [Candidatus Omnitrophota bacterium]